MAQIPLPEGLTPELCAAFDQAAREATHIPQPATGDVAAFRRYVGAVCAWQADEWGDAEQACKIRIAYRLAN